MIQLDNVVKKYKMGETEVRALRGLELEVDRGEYVAVLGPSGSGKSTLMNIIGALDVPDEGDVVIDGENISGYDENRLARLRGERLGFVFQTYNLIQTLTALENVSLPLVFQGKSGTERAETGKELLERVGLEDRLGHNPAELSGGEQQRVAIARALATDPDILLADEPTGNLDTETGEKIMNLLRGLNENQGMTIVMVTHSPADADYADRNINIIDGRITEKDAIKEGV